MDRRIQRALDGEFPVDQLTDRQRGELAACQSVIEQALHEVPDPGPVPDMTGVVMWRIRSLSAGAGAREGEGSRVAGLFRWWWQPRPIWLRPVAALAVVVVLLAGSLALSFSGLFAPAPAVSIATRSQLIQFRLGATGAREVALVGDFGGWQVRYPMEQVVPGVWSTAVPLEPGVYDYAFVVDGDTWVLDPLAPTVPDGFGGANSRLSVLAPERRART